MTVQHSSDALNPPPRVKKQEVERTPRGGRNEGTTEDISVHHVTEGNKGRRGEEGADGWMRRRRRCDEH